MNCKTTLFFIILIMVGAAASAQTVVPFSQLPAGTPNGNDGVVFYQQDTNGLYKARKSSYDSFLSSSNATINWEGLLTNQLFLAALAGNTNFDYFLGTNTYFAGILSTNPTFVSYFNTTVVNIITTNGAVVSNVLFNSQITVPVLSSKTSIMVYDDLSSIPRTATTLTNKAGITFTPDATVAPIWGVAYSAGFVSYRIFSNCPVAFTQTNRIHWFTTTPTVVTNGVISFTSWGSYGGYLTAAYKELCN